VNGGLGMSIHKDGCLTLQHRIVDARMRVCLSDLSLLADIPNGNCVPLPASSLGIAYVYMKLDECTIKVWN